MRKIILVLAVIFSPALLLAQANSFPPVDKSPMDMSYYPANYPVQKIQDKITEPLVARVIYSRPQKAGRMIFGGLVKYGEVWRMGANEATEIQFFKNVKIGGKKIRSGRYTLYALVNETSWTIILNNETDTWGAFKYDAKKDVVRVEVPIQKMDAAVEALAMFFEKTTTGANLVVAWDNVKASLPIQF
ncbi:MAG: DUF2911 domain-containing protein [Sphingobacteriales bacterium]|nr:DUF2911 domain-containing protein [Sphingobacteriales bacterium]